MDRIFIINPELDLDDSVVEDLLLIKKAFEKNRYEVSRYEAYIMWKDYSDSVGEEWADVPESSSEIFSVLTPYFEEE